MITRVEDTLKGGYAGLYNEVVTDDCYRLRKLIFNPDVIFDFGANVGVFTRYARKLFPKTLIVAIEPNAENFEYLTRFTPNDENIIFINAAIGAGQLWHNLGAVNGSGESYVSSGIGYDHYEMIEAEKESGAVEKSDIKTILPDYLINTYVSAGQKYMIKMDIEGGEHAVFQHEPSMKVLRDAEYVCAELHLYALHGGKLYDDMAKKMGEAIASFMPTHRVGLNNVHFWATKN